MYYPKNQKKNVYNSWGVFTNYVNRVGGGGSLKNVHVGSQGGGGGSANVHVGLNCKLFK